MSTLDPTALARHYTAFLHPGRILLTGHSHQAWPDVARAACLQAFDDAANWVDDKWGRVMAKADRVRRAVSHRMGGDPADVALAPNTHELVTRFLSALPLLERPHLVTTDGEFHTIDRQLRRLAEVGIEVTRVPVEPVASLSERLAAALRPDTAAVLASTVLFRTSAIVTGLPEVVAKAQALGVEVLLDAYHAFNAIPFTIKDFASPGSSPSVFVVGGGYKYAQWGEGCCFMTVPAGCTLRPVDTGWFADWGGLTGDRAAAEVAYGASGAERFAGSTFEPTSFYRAAAVADFFDAHDLTVERLRALSLEQTGRLLDRAEGRFPILTPRENRGGFVALHVPGAAEVVKALRPRGVFADSRGDILRLGPAPYVPLEDLDAAVDQVLALAPRAGRA